MQEKFNFNNIPGDKLHKTDTLQNKILISICTIINKKNWDKKFFYSVLNQTFSDFEWIILIKQDLKEKFNEDLKKWGVNDKRVKVISKVGDLCIDDIVKLSKANLIFTLSPATYLDITVLKTMYYQKLNNNYIDILTCNGVNISNHTLINEEFVSKTQKIISIEITTLLIDKNFLMNYKKYENFIANIKETKAAIGKLNFYGIWYAQPIMKKIKMTTNKFVNFPHSCLYNYNTRPNTLPFNESKKNYKKIILCFAPWAKIGGADIFNFKILRFLKDGGYHIILVTTEKCDYEFRCDMEQAVDEYYDLTTFLERQDWPSFIENLIIKYDIRVIFQLSSLYAYYLIPWLKCKYPNIAIIDYVHAEDFSWRNGGFPRDSTAIANFLDKTYVCNKHVGKLMFEKMNRQIKNVDTAYIGVDVNIFNPNKIEITDFVTYEKCKDKKVILFPSRFSYEKRPLLFIEIMAELLKQRKDIICLMIGDGVARDDMKRLICKRKLKDNVILIPLKNDIRQYYKMADITLICSLSEGLTLTTYESLAMNVPIISSNVGGQKELIDNEVGILINNYQDVKKDLMNFSYTKQEINEYVNAIQKILVNYKSYTENDKCRRKILNFYSQKTIFENIEKDICYYIENGSQITSKIENIEFAIMYLVLFNETSKEFYDNSLDMENFKYSFKQKMWQHKWWRYLIKVGKKLKLDILLNKIYFRE